MDLQQYDYDVLQLIEADLLSLIGMDREEDQEQIRGFASEITAELKRRRITLWKLHSGGRKKIQDYQPGGFKELIWNIICRTRGLHWEEWKEDEEARRFVESFPSGSYRISDRVAVACTLPGTYVPANYTEDVADGLHSFTTNHAIHIDAPNRIHSMVQHIRGLKDHEGCSWGEPEIPITRVLEEGTR